MSSIGVFRKVDIDDKSYFIYTSPDETLAMSSDGGHLSFQPLFSCPRSRLKFHKRNLKEDDDGGDDDDDSDDDDSDDDDDIYQPHTCLPHFPSTSIGDPGGKSFLDYNDTCKLPVVPLFWCNDKEPDRDQFQCGACSMSKLSTSYYKCLQCEGTFHKECVESPLEIKHPSHPFHSLRLYLTPSTIFLKELCFYCKEEVSGILYHCSTCDLRLHPICAMKTVSLVIHHPKSHPHPLTFFPAQASLVCNFCAMIKNLDPTYICIICVFAIHEACIGFPHVIRICRHKHRISFTLSLPSGNLSCGVCRKQVDNNYGAYSCQKCDDYFVHSTCALHERLWNGKELEGVPEEEDKIEDGEPFERIADGIIIHPFHSHQLRLEIINAYDITTYCHGCGLPISEDQFYSCVECNFIIHESCAKAPRMIRHPLFPDPLTLSVATKELDYGDDGAGIFRCKICRREGNGFFYESTRGESRIDLPCASIMESFKYEGHEHPLFLPWNPEESVQCQICKYESDVSTLICLICDYTICYGCAALPYRVRYKHDSHLLTICDGKEASDEPDWCEVCEGKIKYEEIREPCTRSNETVRRYYKCNDYCCTALHVHCLLGIDMYMRPHNTENDYLSFPKYSKNYYSWMTNVRILLNNSVSRPICTGCQRRCPFPIVFKRDDEIFCSWNCIGDDILKWDRWCNFRIRLI